MLMKRKKYSMFKFLKLCTLPKNLCICSWLLPCVYFLSSFLNAWRKRSMRAHVQGQTERTIWNFVLLVGCLVKVPSRSQGLCLCGNISYCTTIKNWMQQRLENLITFFFLVNVCFLSLSLTHTHTRTHTLGRLR